MSNLLLKRVLNLNNMDIFKTNNKEFMTVNGTINKSLILILITLASAIFSFYYIHSPLFIVLTGAIGAVIMVILFVWVYVNYNNPKIIKYLSPIYAIVEGLSIGAISQIFESSYEGIVSQALFMTFGIFLIMFLIYKYRIIEVTSKFKVVIISTTLGIAIFYFISFILAISGIYLPTFKSGAVGIGFSLFVGTVASLNLLLDFDMIETMIKNQFPKDFEWYCAFSLLVTLIWIYVEMLSFIKKISDNIND